MDHLHLKSNSNACRAIVLFKCFLILNSTYLVPLLSLPLLASSFPKVLPTRKDDFLLAEDWDTEFDVWVRSPGWATKCLRNNGYKYISSFSLLIWWFLYYTYFFQKQCSCYVCSGPVLTFLYSFSFISWCFSNENPDPDKDPIVKSRKSLNRNATSSLPLLV